MWIPRQELVALLGEKDTEVYLHCFGGQRTYIPERVQEKSPIAKRLGMAIAQKLSAEYPRIVIETPSPPTERDTAKKKIIALLNEGGFSYGQMAYQARVGVRYVEIVASEWKKQRANASAQTSNFP